MRTDSFQPTEPHLQLIQTSTSPFFIVFPPFDEHTDQPLSSSVAPVVEAELDVGLVQHSESVAQLKVLFTVKTKQAATSSTTRSTEMLPIFNFGTEQRSPHGSPLARRMGLGWGRVAGRMGGRLGAT